MSKTKQAYLRDAEEIENLEEGKELRISDVLGNN